AAYFYSSGRKHADILRVHPLAAFARLESIVHRPSTPQPSAEHPPTAPSLTVPSPPPANLPPTPPTSTVPPPSTQSPPPPATQPPAKDPQPPSHSAYIKPLHHAQAITSTSTNA